MGNRQIIQDWTRIDDFKVDDDIYRSFEYHVVSVPEQERTILTIKLYREDDLTVRLDPSDIESNVDFNAFAERRVRYLYARGVI